MGGSVLVISGPSGSGKSSLMGEVLKKFNDLYFSISSTTRKPRIGEENGVHYNFITEKEFINDIENGFFLEWAKVHGNYYGTSLKPVKKAMQEKKLVIFDIDVQGYKIAKDVLGDSVVSIFISTPNQAELLKRLSFRSTESDETLAKRLEGAISEISFIRDYDYMLINEDFDTTLEALCSIIIATKHRVKSIDVDLFLKSWHS